MVYGIVKHGAAVHGRALYKSMRRQKLMKRIGD